MQRDAANRHRRGFTLLEVLVVVAITATTATIVLPRLGASDATGIDVGARRLADALTLARDRAIARGRDTRVLIDVDAQQWRIDDAVDTLPAAVRFHAVTPDGRPTLHAGTVPLVLRAAGTTLPIVIDLADRRGHRARVVLPPVRGRATVTVHALS